MTTLVIAHRTCPRGGARELPRRHRGRDPVRRRRRRGQRPPQPGRHGRPAPRPVAAAGAARAPARAPAPRRAPGAVRRPDAGRRPHTAADAGVRLAIDAKERAQRLPCSPRCGRPAPPSGCSCGRNTCRRSGRTCAPCPTPRSRSCATPSIPPATPGSSPMPPRSAPAPSPRTRTPSLPRSRPRPPTAGLAVYCWYQRLDVQRARLPDAAAHGLAGGGHRLARGHT